MRLLLLAFAACTAPGPTDQDDTDLPETDDTDVAPDTDDTDTDPTDTDDTEPAVETDDTEVVVEPACTLGTGLTALEPFPPEGMPVIRGPQGGWHVFGSLVCEGIEGGSDRDLLDPTNPTVSWRVLDGEGALLAGYENLRRPMATPEGPRLIGEFLVFRTRTYAEVLDRDVTVDLYLRDVNGAEIRLSAATRLVAPEGWVPVDTSDTAGLP